jgi:hypothetical protein
VRVVFPIAEIVPVNVFLVEVVVDETGTITLEVNTPIGFITVA